MILQASLRRVFNLTKRNQTLWKLISGKPDVEDLDIDSELTAEKLEEAAV